MAKRKFKEVAISMDMSMLKELDREVQDGLFENRSHAIRSWIKRGREAQNAT